MLTLLHFADAHIDMAAHGRHDPESGLPVRVLDFLKALDTIVDTAIQEKVDLVVFAGDTYKDRTPVPTFQREWGRRIMRLSRAGIPTLLLVGNHDLSPAAGRAHTLHEYDTLEVPYVKVLGKPAYLGPQDLWGLPLQVIALPWINRSGLMAALQVRGLTPDEVAGEVEARVTPLIEALIAEADPTLPTVLTAHASVQGATYGGERSVMLGADVVLPGGLLRDPRLDYVALGHIHKAQNLNPDAHPPVIYPGSIERVDFGEVVDDKFFVVARVERGKTEVEWRKLHGRRFLDRSLTVGSQEDFMQQVLAVLPPAQELEGAIFRLTLAYPRDWEPLLDEAALRAACTNAFEFHLIRRPKVEASLRLPNDQTISSLSPLDLLDRYFGVVQTNSQETPALRALADEVIRQVNEE